jgi:hypothetical protein
VTFLSCVCVCVRSIDLRLVPNRPRAAVLATSPPSPQYGANRIAFGTKVFFSDCKMLSDDEGMMELSFGQEHTRGVWQKENIKFDLANDLSEVKYYIAGDTSDNEEASVKPFDERTESMSFLAMKIDISKSSRHPNHYTPNVNHCSPNARHDSNSKGYILIEFRSDTEFTELLQLVETIKILRPYFDKQAQLTAKTADHYCQPFIMDSKKETKMSCDGLESPKSRKKRGFLAGRKKDFILLVYPFDADKELIEKTAVLLPPGSTGPLRYQPGYSRGRRRHQ